MSPTRQVFYSFHYKRDSWRAAQVRNMRLVDGNRPATDNDWEAITRGGTSAIKRWIDQQMQHRSCTVVLVGEYTAGREWIDYEIRKSWRDVKGIVGIRIHGLRNRDGRISNKGKNPFAHIRFDSGKKLSSVVKCYDPEGTNSRDRYESIAKNLSRIIEEAISIRKRYQ